jgi:K+-sensing histidine kinase KdpD
MNTANVYCLYSPKGEVIFTNTQRHCTDCIVTCNVSATSIVKCAYTRIKRRKGTAASATGKVFLCSGELGCVNSSRLFKEKLCVYLEFINDIKGVKDKVIGDVNKETKRLLHNLTSLNAHNIQELYSLVPQELLTEKLHKQIDIIKEHLISNVNEAAFSFLRVAKNNASIKTEFSVFRKLYETDPSLQIKLHPIKKVLLNTFHIFFQDFTDKKVYVKIGTTEDKVLLDYESFHVALYHFVDNATKYIIPSSTLDVSFESYPTCYKIIFDMISLEIIADELDSILEEGKSGTNAIKLGKSGDGIGLSIICKLLNLNNCNLIIKRNVNPAKSFMFDGHNYHNNIFEMIFNK